MELTILIIVLILVEPILICAGVYFALYKFGKSSKKIIKIKAPVKPFIDVTTPITTNKKSVILPHDSIYTTSTMRETPVKYAGGDLVPYGLSDSDKALLEMFYSKD